MKKCIRIFYRIFCKWAISNRTNWSWSSAAIRIGQGRQFSKNCETSEGEYGNVLQRPSRFDKAIQFIVKRTDVVSCQALCVTDLATFDYESGHDIRINFAWKGFWGAVTFPNGRSSTSRDDERGTKIKT